MGRPSTNAAHGQPTQHMDQIQANVTLRDRRIWDAERVRADVWSDFPGCGKMTIASGGKISIAASVQIQPDFEAPRLR